MYSYYSQHGSQKENRFSAILTSLGSPWFTDPAKRGLLESANQGTKNPGKTCLTTNYPKWWGKNVWHHQLKNIWWQMGLSWNLMDRCPVGQKCFRYHSSCSQVLCQKWHWLFSYEFLSVFFHRPAISSRVLSVSCVCFKDVPSVFLFLSSHVPPISFQFPPLSFYFRVVNSEHMWLAFTVQKALLCADSWGC